MQFAKNLGTGGDLAQLATIGDGGLSSLIQPPAGEHEEVSAIATKEHAAEPLKDKADIAKMTNYFREHGKHRDLMLWIVGLNTALRVSDLLRLRFCDIMGVPSSGGGIVFLPEIVIQEKKTKNTKKRAVNRHIAINDAIKAAVVEYLGSQAQLGNKITLDMYLFRSESNNGKSKNVPMHRNAVEQLLKRAAKETGIAERIHVSCHTMRKTYAYHMLSSGGNTQRSLILLQKMLNHSSVNQTLAYAGITADEMREQYLGMNLGLGIDPGDGDGESQGADNVILFTDFKNVACG